MGTGFCCCVPPQMVSPDDMIIEEEVFNSVDSVAIGRPITGDNQFAEATPPLAQEVTFPKHTTQKHPQWKSTKASEDMESTWEQRHLSEPDGNDLQYEAIDQNQGKIETELDESTDGTISALEETVFITSDEEGAKEEESDDEAQNSYKLRDASMISLRVQSNKVVGAGSAAANGVYRWFVAHRRFVMFTEDGQYQIRGDANLSELGDRYLNCWVIEEIRENVVRLLYAVASSNRTCAPSGGWICIEGASPAPEVEQGDDREIYENGGFMEFEESETSVYPLRSSRASNVWDENHLNSVSVVEWVA